MFLITNVKINNKQLNFLKHVPIKITLKIEYKTPFELSKLIKIFESIIFKLYLAIFLFLRKFFTPPNSLFIIIILCHK